jgi:hypothetical protein
MAMTDDKVDDVPVVTIEVEAPKGNQMWVKDQGGYSATDALDLQATRTSIDPHLMDLVPENLGEELPPAGQLVPPTEDEMMAQVKVFQTKELTEALDDLRKTGQRVKKAMRAIISELNRRERIR